MRQFLEGELVGPDAGRRRELLAGAAALPEPVFVAEANFAGSTDVARARLHGLFWLTADLAEAGAQVLVVDDAHGGDAASLRFLDALARRSEDVPVASAVGARAPKPRADQDLLDGIATGTTARILARRR